LEEGILDEFVIYNRDGVVKSPLLRHSRVGGNPERVEMTGSGQREPKLPSAHRTVRTGPYTAPQATLIH